MTIQTTESTPILPAAGSTGASLIREAAAVMADAHALAKAVASTQMIPKHFQGKPDEVAAAMLYGASLGLDPMQSVRQIYVVHGQAALYARAMDALVKGAGHETWTVETSDESVTVAGRRRGSANIEKSTWTLERAKKAGYTNNEKYRTDPQAMLYSKALSEVCRKIAPDVLNGVYAVEELQMERWNERPAAPASPGLGAIYAEQVVEPEPDEALTDHTRREMFALFGERGIESRDAQITGIINVIGREIQSRGELTEAEGRQVVASLRGAA